MAEAIKPGRAQYSALPGVEICWIIIVSISLVVEVAVHLYQMAAAI